MQTDTREGEGFDEAEENGGKEGEKTIGESVNSVSADIS